jgi:xylulokinase
MEDSFMAVLGIDLGTSSCKTVLVDLDGSIIAQASFPYPLSTPKPLWSEQNPEDWWQALIQSVRKVLSNNSTLNVQAIGLSGQMHGLVLADKNNHILRPAILWNDGRAQKESEALYEQIPNYLQETGNIALAGHPAPKILWVQRHEPEVWKKVNKLCLPKDYLGFCLTDHWASDMSDGSGTLLLLQNVLGTHLFLRLVTFLWISFHNWLRAMKLGVIYLKTQPTF